MLPAKAKRVALVIGNDSYQSVTPLQNARADARAVADTLKREEFSVTLKEDVTLKGMKDALRAFKEQISGGDEAVFYYSGHGVQFEGTNYLISGGSRSPERSASYRRRCTASADSR